MTALKTLTVAVAAIAIEVVAILLMMSVTLLLLPDSTTEESYGVRLSGAVAMFVLWSVPAAALAFMAIRLGAHRLRASFLTAVFIVAAFNGLIALPLLAYTSLVNECYWHVPFPLGGIGGSSECSFGD